MRRTNPLVAAVMGTVVALLALVAFPGLGVGETITSHGGSPSDVFMSTGGDAVCNGDDKVRVEPVSLMPTAVSVGTTSHVLVYFSSTWSGAGKETEVVLRLQISGDDFFQTSPESISQGGSQGITIHALGTVMWTFDDIPAGDYTVEATAQLAAFTGAVQSGDGANFQTCALTAFVIPVA
jgi:hypothetical protein